MLREGSMNIRENSRVTKIDLSLVKRVQPCYYSEFLTFLRRKVFTPSGKTPPEEEPFKSLLNLTVK